MEQPRICVVGASNIDLISYVPRMPNLGETLHGEKFTIGFGGKGANQAVMAAKLGGNVAMITKLGKDVFGENTLKNFQELGINTKGVTFTEHAFSGVAPIVVDPQGDNSIIIVTGANNLLSIADLQQAQKVITGAQVLTCQLEIPLEISLEAMRMAKAAGMTTLFNPAPARGELPSELYQLSEIVCLNESEAEILLDKRIETPVDAIFAAKILLKRGTKTVILTLGERGCLLLTPETIELTAGETVDAIDTTGAGDCFIGSLAYFIGAGKSVKDAVYRANKIAAISVQNLGTQTSFPEAGDLPAKIMD